MSAKNNKVDLSEENKNASQAVDKSKRSFTKAGVAAPIIMTLASNTALGSTLHCSMSGAQSGNASSTVSTPPKCAAGFSPGGWWKNACKTGNQDGNLNHWCKTGLTPYSIKTTTTGSSKNRITTKSVIYKTVPMNTTSTPSSCTDLPGCTTWADIFTTITGYKLQTAIPFSLIFGSIPLSGIDGPLWDVLNQKSGTLEWHAICDYLNAKLYATGNAPTFASIYSGVSASDIVGLYKLARFGSPSFTSSSGTLIDGSFNDGSGGSGASSYLAAIHP